MQRPWPLAKANGFIFFLLEITVTLWILTAEVLGPITAKKPTYPKAGRGTVFCRIRF
jgi:hypothetical protein